jgi:predicted secreted protein
LSIPIEYFVVQGTSGNPIELPIAAGPATGHVWKLELPHGVERIEDGPQRPVDPSTRLGGATGGNLRVKAPRGEHVITARLARPWQPDSPARVVQIRLHVD